MTPKQERALAALVLCPTAREAAKAAGLSESTLRRYKQDPTFLEEYRKRCNESLEAASPAVIVEMGKRWEELTANIIENF